MTAAAASPATADALTCRSVHVSFGDTEALRGVDLRLAAGEWLGLIGPQRCRQVHVAAAIAGLVPHAGTVALDCGGRPAGPTWPWCRRSRSCPKA